MGCYGGDGWTHEYEARRIWFYDPRDWTPNHWWERIVYFGGDEWERRTVVLFGWMVVALWRQRAEASE